MRAVAAVAILSLLTACSSEPDFDERYDAAEEHIRKTARDIDSEIGQSEQAEQTGPAAAPASQAPPG